MTIQKVPERILAVLGERNQFIMGNVAVAYGAILAGCRFYGGYPITPSTEIMESMGRLLPRVDGVFIQMEDEIASIASVIGASMGGMRSMTATSGPGFSLMQENIGYGCMTETPTVIVNVMRSGPSTGQPTEPAQGDVMQARWGTHGDHEIITLYPSSCQEALEMTIEAFNLADMFSMPVILLMDAEIGHMKERVTIPDEVERTERRVETIDTESYVSYRQDFGHTDMCNVPDIFGTNTMGYHTGLTHDMRGVPVTCDVKVHEGLVRKLAMKVTNKMEGIQRTEDYMLEDADRAIVSYGITSRCGEWAVKLLRDEGIKAGHLRLRNIWPFPKDRVYELAGQVDKILVVEMNMGQMFHRVRQIAKGQCEMELLSKVGGAIPTPAEIMERMR